MNDTARIADRRVALGAVLVSAGLALGLCLHALPGHAKGGMTPRRLETGRPRAVGTNVDMIPLGYEAEASSRVGAVDLDGDGADEIMVASAKEIVAIRYGGYNRTFIVWKSKSRGGATAIGSGDVDGDGTRDLLVGWGAHREKRDAPAQLVVYRSHGAGEGELVEEVVVSPKTTRAQFTAISVTQLDRNGPHGVLYANYTTKHQARGAFAHFAPSNDAGKGTWKDRQLYQRRMAAELAAGPMHAGAEEISIFVGRPYGDESKTPGDVYRFDPGGKHTIVPSTRGVRSLAVVLLGSHNIPRYRVCFGDGWHWRYKSEAKGLVSCAKELEDGSFESEMIEDTQGYEISNMAAADLDGDGVQELIARGPRALYRFIPVVAVDGLETWDPRIIGPGGKQFAIIDVDKDGRDEIIIGGEKPALLKLR